MPNLAVHLNILTIAVGLSSALLAENAQACRALPELANGKFSNGSNSIGAVRFASCSQGFGLTTNRTIICNRDSQWTKFPACQKVKFNSEIFKAVEDGDQQKIRRLVQEEVADVNAKQNNSDGFNLLEIAAINGSLEVFQLLVDLGAVSDSKTTPLHYASMMGHLRLVRWLVVNGADVYAERGSEHNRDLPVHSAATMGQVEIVRFFIQNFPDLAIAKNAWGGYPIHLAALGDQVAVVEYFITIGQDVDVRTDDKWNRTSLHHAASAGKLDTVQLLVRKGANVYAKSNPEDNEDMPVHLAAYFGHVGVVEFFVENWPDLKNATNKIGNFPIHRATLGNQLQVVEYFVTSTGMDIETRDVGEWQRTPLHKAASEGHLELVKWLVSKGADIYAKSGPEDAQSMAVHLAAVFGQLEVVRFFEENYPDLKSAVNGQGDYSLHRACLGNALQVVDYFITTIGVGVDFPSGGKLTRTCLHVAADQGHIDLVKWLVSKGANIYAKSGFEDNEDLPVHLAAAFGRLKVVKYFVENYPNLKTASNVNGNHPVHKAALAGQQQIVEYFVAIGVDVDVRDSSTWRRTCLHGSALYGHLEVVKWLVSKGANVYAKSSPVDLESLPIHLAAYFGRLNVVKFFIENFPDLLNATNIGGHTPLQRAQRSQQPGASEVVKWLKSRYNF